jgi:hypothetical protein
MNIWMYSLKATHCCSLIRQTLNDGPDGGSCPPVGPCRGFGGNCADLTAQFSDLPVLPDFPNGLSDFECTAFPDDANFLDSFLVGLLSVAAALPVTFFITSCFDLADDSDAPDSFLSLPLLAWPRFVWGFSAHKNWRYGGPTGQPRHFVRWYVRFREQPFIQNLCQFLISIWCTLTCHDPPWYVEAPVTAEMENAHKPETAEEEDARVAGDEHDIFFKHALDLAGLLSVYMIWAVFTWFIFVYGVQIYSLLGGQAVSAFSKTFGVSYAIHQISEWQGIMHEVGKAVIILIILERLFLSPPLQWMEEHIGAAQSRLVLRLDDF